MLPVGLYASFIVKFFQSLQRNAFCSLRDTRCVPNIHRQSIDQPQLAPIGCQHLRTDCVMYHIHLYSP